MDTKPIWFLVLLGFMSLAFLLPATVFYSGGWVILMPGDIGIDMDASAAATLNLAAILCIVAVSGVGICAASLGSIEYDELCADRHPIKPPEI